MLVKINGAPGWEVPSYNVGCNDVVTACQHVTDGDIWHTITNTASAMDSVMEQVSGVTWITHITYKAGAMLANGLNDYVHYAINETIKNCSAGTGCF